MSEIFFVNSIKYSKKNLHDQGYKKLVSGEFKQKVEKYLKTEKEIPGDIHEQFMSQSYRK